MKSSLIFASLLLAILPGLRADQGGDDPKMLGLKQLDARVDKDLASGKLTKNDGDELKGEISRVQALVAREGRLTGKTKHDVYQDVQKINKDLARKEAQAKALASASPTP